MRNIVSPLYSVGDWLQHKTLSSFYLKVEVVYFSNSRQEFVYKGEGLALYESDSVLWVPKVGEWCWKGSQFVRIAHVSNRNRSDGLLTFTCVEPATATSYISSFRPEPFIGRLPSAVLLGSSK